ncbi:MAG TPA: hypothetical protein VFR15_04675, partial [Chloroflexia bacterium]|nr:hypothetical protein [Chloroflexia bacterium]
MVDGTDDWTGAVPPVANLGHLSRGSDNGGEYVWRDQPGDEVTAFISPDPRVDLTGFRVTGDSTNLYVYAKTGTWTPEPAPDKPQVQVAVDMDRDGTGTLALGGGADTNVSSGAGWERLLVTRFGSGNSDV